MTRSVATAERIAAVAIALLGTWVLWEAFQLREGPGYAAVGPRVFPVLVGLGLLGSGLALLGSGFRRSAPSTAADGEPEPTDWRALLLMAGLLLGFVLLFQPLGFVLTSAGFMIAGAWALGSGRPVRDAVAGVVLSLVTFLVFTRLLGLELPAGPLEGPLQTLRAMVLVLWTSSAA